MCNREISSRRIDWSFPRSSTTIRGRSPGGGRTPPPPDRPRYEKCPDRARVKTQNFAPAAQQHQHQPHVIKDINYEFVKYMLVKRKTGVSSRKHKASMVP